MDHVAKPAIISKLVNYQDDSVVSRTLIEKETGTVTLFAFSKGQALSEHTAPFDAMVHILDGKAEITISGNLNILGSGQMIIMPANEPHALKATENFKMLLTMIRS
ncbi:MAG: cupin domain-containing protein [Candidatus Cloacimonetes bacterium]|jgi:quercetin dioxygenase-like cupin family protein|nr:cupin domain-containing protein [Candidatus Cloacimonadota bacterium]